MVQSRLRCLRSGSAIVLLCSVLTSCGTFSVSKVTPWFEIRHFRPAEPVPHVIALGSRSTKAFIKAGTGWRRVDDGEDAWIAYRLEDAVGVE